MHTSKIQAAFETEAAKQLHAHLQTKEFENGVIEHTKSRSRITIKAHTDKYICNAMSEWLDAHAVTIFQEQAKTVLKEDFVDILENLILPGNLTINRNQFKIEVNPFVSLAGITSIGVGVGFCFISPPIGISMIAGGYSIAIGGLLFTNHRLDSASVCKKALSNLTETCLREYIHESTQRDISKCMETFFKADVLKKIDALKKSIEQTKVEVDKYKTQEAELRSMALKILKCSNKLETIQWSD